MGHVCLLLLKCNQYHTRLNESAAGSIGCNGLKLGQPTPTLSLPSPPAAKHTSIPHTSDVGKNGTDETSLRQSVVFIELFSRFKRQKENDVAGHASTVFILDFPAKGLDISAKHKIFPQIHGNLLRYIRFDVSHIGPRPILA